MQMNKGLVIACLLLAVSAHALSRPAAVHPQETRQSEGTGRIVGRVRVEGRFEKPAPLKVYKNRNFCGAAVPNESFVVGPEGGLLNAAITIPGVREPAKAPLEGLVLDNKNCAFVPHVQVAPVGSDILLLNSDPILHDVHARMGTETLFNVGLPTWRQVEKRLSRAGIVKLECDVLHTWMSAYIVVTSSPYFAVTDRRGEFVIDPVPDGNYEVHVWHEKLGSRSKRATVAGGRTLFVDFVYRLGRREPDEGSHGN
jgi:hypothetical protein